jgi:hypothetical protein
MNPNSIKIVWLASLLLSIPPIAYVPHWPGFLTAQLAWGAYALLITSITTHLMSRYEKRLARELFSVLIGLGIGLIASLAFKN